MDKGGYKGWDSEHTINVLGAANPSFLQRDKEMMRYPTETMKVREDNEILLEKATRTEKELVIVKKSPTCVEEEAAAPNP